MFKGNAVSFFRGNGILGRKLRAEGIRAVSRAEGKLTEFLSIVNQIIHDRRIGQGGRITEVTERLGGDIS